MAQNRSTSPDQDPTDLETQAGDAPVTPTDTATGAAPAKVPPPDTPKKSAGLLGSAWVGLVAGAVFLVLLLVFVVQNSESETVEFLAWSFQLPLGVTILFAAILGALIMATLAGFRILQLRMRAHKAAKLQRKQAKAS